MENFLIKPKFYILHSTLYIHKSLRMRSIGGGSARGWFLAAACAGGRSLPPRLRRFVHKNRGLLRAECKM